MFDYDMVGVPLVYTQLAVIATYLYFAVLLVGRSQFLDPEKDIVGNNIDFYFPFFSTIEFIVFCGWLKVALKMLDPYGLDTDDVSFDLHWVLHRNVEVGNTMLKLSSYHPKLQSTIPLTGSGSSHRRAGTYTGVGGGAHMVGGGYGVYDLNPSPHLMSHG